MVGLCNFRPLIMRAAACLAGLSLLLSVAGVVHADTHATDAGRTATYATSEPAPRRVPDSVELEQQLQALDWGAFRSVVEAVPKLRQSVDAYGPFGWEYVRMNYQRYPWRKPIDRLDDTQKVTLAELIAQARARQPTAGS